jgi:hypothetical protein
MHTVSAGHLGEPLGSDNGLRRFRKPWDRLRDGCVASTLGVHVKAAVIWGALPSGRPELVGHMAQAP